jgi:3-deoxy-7-phosphoheptulonate synthase
MLAIMKNDATEEQVKTVIRELDLSAILSIKKEVSHLPVVVDPSHAAGRRGAIAVGADGILVEVHNDPLHALSDGMQSLYPEQFAELMKEIKVLTR